MTERGQLVVDLEIECVEPVDALGFRDRIAVGVDVVVVAQLGTRAIRRAVLDTDDAALPSASDNASQVDAPTRNEGKSAGSVAIEEWTVGGIEARPCECSLVGVAGSRQIRSLQLLALEVVERRDPVQALIEGIVAVRDRDAHIRAEPISVMPVCTCTSLPT